jgi:hypothetical protein
LKSHIKSHVVDPLKKTTPGTDNEELKIIRWCEQKNVRDFSSLNFSEFAQSVGKSKMHAEENYEN